MDLKNTPGLAGNEDCKLVKKGMQDSFSIFDGMPDRLLKYMEILLEGEDASPYCYQDTMSFRGLCIGITTLCNKHCEWCYRFDPSYKHLIGQELPIEKLKTIVHNTKGKFRMVHLAGLGEPTMYPHLLEAISIVKKLSSNVRITTNAAALNEEFVDKLVDSGLTDVEVSIWGFDEEKEEKIRGVDLPHTIKIVEYMSNHTPLRVQINSLVSSSHCDGLLPIVERLKGANKLLIHTIPLFETKQAIEKGVRRISKEEYRTLLERMHSDILKYKLDWKMFPTPEGSKFDPIIDMKIKKNICFTCFEDPYISEKGELVPCGRMQPFGGVDATEGFEKAWNHPGLLEFRANMLEGNYPDLCGQVCYLKDKTSLEK